VTCKKKKNNTLEDIKISKFAFVLLANALGLNETENDTSMKECHS